MTTLTHFGRLAFTSALALLAPALAGADIINANPANYRTALGSLSPGDTLLLAPGTYTQGLPIDGMSGTAAQPIVIAGPDDQSAVIVARDCCNTVQLRDGAAYIEIKNLTLDG